MLFEFALIGAAHLGAKKLHKDGPLAARGRKIAADIAGRIADLVFPIVKAATHPAASAATSPSPPRSSAFHGKGQAIGCRERA